MGAYVPHFSRGLEWNHLDLSVCTRSKILTCHHPQNDSALLYACLRSIIERNELFGGSLFALAASVFTDLVHHDPLVYRELDAAGIPDALIKAAKVGDRDVNVRLNSSRGTWAQVLI